MPILSTTKMELPKPIKHLKPIGIEIDKNANYGWFPVTGDSMTDEDYQYSIPTGSKILAREIDIGSIFDFPTHKPVAIMGTTPSGDPFRLVKTITFVDGVGYNIRCTSYNKKYKDFWIPMRHISRVFVVEQILLPRKRKPINVVL